MRMSARGAMRTRQDSRKLTGFSKMWKSGDSVHVFYPIFWDEEAQTFDILVGACWGHSVNPKEIELKRVFIPSNSEIIDGEPKSPDTLFQFSRIAPLFKEGEKQKKVREQMDKANITESIRKAAIKKIEDEYEDKDPAVGKLRFVISTECVVVPLTADGKPEADKARLVTQDLSDTKINAILALLSDAKFKPENKDQRYFEVQYSFGSTGDRKQDGKVTPVGLTPEYTLKHRFPDSWSAIEQQLDGLPESHETIQKRNPSFRPVEESEILSAISMYATIESTSIDSVEDEALERAKRNAAILHKLNIPVNNPDIQEAIDDYVQELAERESLMATDNVGATSNVTEAPSMEQLMQEHREEVRTAREREEDEVTDDLMTRAEAASVPMGDFSSLT